MQTGTSNELNVGDYFRANNMKYREVIAFATLDETVKAYESGRCDVFTSDKSQLAAVRLKLTNPADHVLLPETISKEPLGPLVRHGDDQWFDLVKWTYFALLNSEELGITQKNVDEMVKSENPDIKRLLGTDGKYGEGIGLTPGLGGAHHQGDRQLRRDLRPQCRPRHPARHRARPQQPLDQGWHPVRPAGALSAPRDLMAHALLENLA